MLQLNHAYDEPWEVRDMNTVKLFLYSILCRRLFGNVDNQGGPWPPMAGLQVALCCVALSTGMFEIRNKILTRECSNYH